MKKWKNVVGYEGIYQVNEIGEIWSLPRIDCNGHTRGSRILKQHDRRGYRVVCLCKNGMKKTVSVHRIVATAFIKNDNDFPCINHKNEVKSDNRVENLEWCTYSYNRRYGTFSERMVKNTDFKKRKENTDYKTIGLKVAAALSKAVLQFDGNDELVSEWKSTREIERTLGYDHRGISRCCNAAQKTSHGYTWKYKEEVYDPPHSVELNNI